MTRARADPYSDRCRSDVVHSLADYCQTVVEDCSLDGTFLIRSCGTREGDASIRGRVAQTANPTCFFHMMRKEKYNICSVDQA